MPQFLSKLTDEQAKVYYNYLLKKEVERVGYCPTLKGKQGRLNHDIWNAYDYGDIVKFVYIKSAPPCADPSRDPLYPETMRPKPKIEKHPRPEGERFSNSVSRSKARVFELAMCNEFTHFCTFTQDENKRDRFDLKDFRKDFAQLVRNLNRERAEDCKIKYLLIPEQHKNGAWHMHGLLMGLNDSDLRLFSLDEKLPQKIRKQLKNGEKVYDWSRYRRSFGYFTCTEISSGTACAKYITKYISKDLQKTVRAAGEHLFFASQRLKSRAVIMKNCTDKCPIDEWDFENDFVKVKEIKVR